MDFKKEFFKYFQFWPWFVVSLILCVCTALYYIKIVPPTYQTSALINIDKEQEAKSKIYILDTDEKNKEDDLSDEIALVTSNDFLSKVVNGLQLNINYFEKGYFHNKSTNEVPFIIKTIISNDSLPQIKYDVKIVEEGLLINNPIIEKSYLIRSHETSKVFSGLPFTIQFTPKAKQNRSLYLNKEYVISIEPTILAINNLKTVLNVGSFESQNTNLFLTHEGTNPILSRKILNELIILLDKNIVINKQKLFVNTVSYLNKRIKNFTTEKDSIESVKEKYLQNNDILVMENYIIDKTSAKYNKKESAMLNKRQIELTKFAINDIRNSSTTTALGTDYKLDAPSVNQMLLNYNTRLMESDMLLQRAQKNNPAYQSLVSQLKVQKQAILNTLDDYSNYVNQTNVANMTERNIANSEANSIPTKDKILGNINSNLKLKEVTYLALLQKREDAILNGSIVESNIKTLNSPQTNYSAIFPQPKSVLLGSILFSLLFPLGIVYLNLQLDTKIHNEEDIQKVLSNIPFLGIIPNVNINEKLDNTANSRSIIAEASRTVFSNISYLLPKKKEQSGNVILFSSSIQGEGKSFCAFHNAISISNHNKKVLLIGADLRNPQLHDYFSAKKGNLGLTDFLSNKKGDWKEFLLKETDFSDNLDTLFSGAIPPNPTQLLTNTNFELLIEEAKRIYDFIIIDSAPIQMVSDTLNFSYLADVTVFVARYDFTDKSTLAQVNNFIKKGQLKNVGVVINGVSKKSAYGYNYGANYNYQYQEKQMTEPRFKRILS